jgi:hypothetical protein
MVAAAGEQGAVKSSVGLACLAAVAVGLVLLSWLAQFAYLVNRAGLEQHPEALAATARQIIEKLGYSKKAADSASGFADGENNLFYFYYRQSPNPLVVFEDKYPHPYKGFTFGKPDDEVPAWTTPGQLGVRLRPNGHLLRFRAIPPDRTSGRTAASPADLAAWFPEELTGFKLTELQETPGPKPRPPDFCDRHQVWRGIEIGTTNEFLVQAALLEGKPVYYEVMGAIEPVVPPPAWQGQLTGVVCICFSATAAFLAWRNIRLGRSDRKGAFRVAFYLFAVGMLVCALVGQHTSTTELHLLLNFAVAQASLGALLFWLDYVALEPFVRRLWPQSLISWSRLTMGQWRDPLIGRDLLFGTLLAVILTLLQTLSFFSKVWVGAKPWYFPCHPWVLDCPGSLIGLAMFGQLQAILLAFFGLLALVILRWLLRNNSVAFVVAVVLCTGLFGGWKALPVDWLIVALMIALLYGCLVLFGFLATVVAIFGLWLTSFPLTLDFSAWYASHGLFAIGLLVAMAVFGFYTSRGRQPIFASPVRTGGRA